MKRLLLTIILSVNFMLADNTNPKTNLTHVTVYLDGAQITRTANVSLPIGTTEFTFDKLSPYIQESSIQISGLDKASVLSINNGINYLSKRDNTEEIDSLQDRIKVFKDKIQFEGDLISGYNEELTILQTNRRLGNENQVVSLEKVQQFAEYYRKQTTAIRTKIYDANKKIEGYEKEINDIKLQLQELNVDDKQQTGEIKVKLNTEVATNLNLIINYNVSNAGWFPIYDLKAEKINQPLKLSYKAHVYQSTGINWDDVKLTLSTSDPNTNNIKPDVNTKYLNFVSGYYKQNRATKSYNYKYNPFIKTVTGTVLDENGLPLPGATVIVKGTTTGVSTNFDGNYSINVEDGQELQFSYVGYASESLPVHSSTMNVSLDADASQLDEVVVVGYGVKKEFQNGFTNRVQEMAKNDDWDDEPYEEPEYTSNGDIIEEGITNTRFEILKPYSIMSDGDVTVIEIDNYSVPAQYQYFTAPVLNENVFLTAKFGNWEQYNLLPGEANVYFEGSYSGKTNINPHATNDSLTVSLGVDPNVVVKRNQLNDFKKTNFIGNNKIFNKAYEIEVKNNKAAAIDLVLMDRIPISQNKDIKVDDIETGTSYYDDKKGLMEWKIKLPSKDTKTYKFSYSVKYPKYKTVNL